ncbi:hypothetical protein AVEN_206266-1 [Araneus ventricosus]|uniref:Uncharacterized protein n=1 Tax=Araneus ventricosus TaxID=182803 RepID=A0A4Y2CUJ4_ARAVE|nr:hypothetical protein AVEN_169573-1 [Araneus ventricosus]GBN22157.1 hypothetical protein AVEN_206266-1 [Araneus ventricosus]
MKLENAKQDLAVRDPGPLSHSRWLTTANRTLRLYLSEESPTPELQEIVVFILKSYMPIWFSINTSKYFREGPKLVNQPIQSFEDLRNLVGAVIKRNGFFAHPEHLMLAMTQDNTKLIRELGLLRILKARQLDQKRTTIRTFMPPKLNFKAQDYSEIINWIDCDLSSPPLLKDSSDDEIKSHIQSDSVPNWDITFKTCPVRKSSERCVKLVTEASGKVC